MGTETPIYLMLEPNESRLAKKSILSTEMSFLKIVKTIKNYKTLRSEELILRMQMNRLIKETNIAIRRTKASFPFVKLPEKQKIEEIKTFERKKTETAEDVSLEMQLKEIQEQLKRMAL